MNDDYDILGPYKPYMTDPDRDDYGWLDDTGVTTKERKQMALSKVRPGSVILSWFKSFFE